MTKQPAAIDLDAAYTVLVEECGAPDGEWDRTRFVVSVGEQLSPDRSSAPTEYRFQGPLGFGGKFRTRYGGWGGERFIAYVDCYREDTTPERMAMIGLANERLAELVAQARAAEPDLRAGRGGEDDVR